MPWTSGQVDKFKKGLTDTQKEKWVSIANEVLKKCIAEGGDEIACEANAVKIANSKVGKQTKKNANFDTNPLMTTDKKEVISLMLAEVGEDEYQLVFPIGSHTTSKYGEVIITQAYVKRMKENADLLHKKFGKKVYLDTQHDFGEANAWAESVDDIKFDDDGIKIKWSFNDKGNELIKDKRYRYMSSAIGWSEDIESGEEMFPCLIAVSLTNNPVMYQMPEVHLDMGKPAHSDGLNKPKEAKMTYDELKKAVTELELSDEQKAEMVKELGVEPEKDPKVEKELSKATDENKMLKEVNKELSERLDKVEANALAKRKSEAIEAALTDRKIDPADREKWEKRFDSNPDLTEEILADMPAKKSEPVGHAGNKPGVEPLSDEDKKLANSLGLTEKDYAKYADGVPVEPEEDETNKKGADDGSNS